MDQPFAHTLSFVDLEVLVLVEHGGASPREGADCLGMDLEETKGLFHDLVHRGLLTGQDESTTFPLTPIIRLEGLGKRPSASPTRNREVEAEKAVSFAVFSIAWARARPLHRPPRGRMPDDDASPMTSAR